MLILPPQHSGHAADHSSPEFIFRNGKIDLRGNLSIKNENQLVNLQIISV